MQRGTLLRAALTFGLLGVLAAPAAAQDIEDVIGRYSGANADGYLQPLADVLSAALGSGWARSADIRPGFHLKLSAIGAGAPVSDDARTFRATTEDFNPQQTVDAPTIFGAAQTVSVSGAGGTTFVFPGGLDTDYMGTLIPQITIGTVAGTEAMVRWFSVEIDEEFGSVSQLGLGLRHDVDQYFNELPVQLALGGYWQEFELGDAVKATATTVMLHGSWAANVLTLFGGLGYETASVDFSWTPEGATTGIDVALDGANSIRGTIGAGVNVWLLGIFADYTVASQSAFTVGVEIGS